MSVICHIDGSEHPDIASLHALLKRFRIKQEAYWHEFLPRRNRLTGDLIPYKDYDQYMTQEFATKHELKTWIKMRPDEAREWAIDWLKARKTEKNLVYAPSQAELRTLMCPSMPYYDSIGGYYEITRALGYLDRYGAAPLTFAALPADATIICDSREQNPLKLAAPTVVAKVDAGDYALAAPYDQGIYIERKSLADFAGTMSKGNARFRRELDRARTKGHYIVMLVESSITDAQGLNHLPQTRHVKASASFILKQMRDLLADYPLTLQVVFVDGRIEAAQKALRILMLGQQVKTVDLQDRYEKGEL